MELAEKVARAIKIKRLRNAPGMDEVAVRLNSEPMYNEIQEAQIWLAMIRGSGALVLESIRDAENIKPGMLYLLLVKSNFIGGRWAPDSKAFLRCPHTEDGSQQIIPFAECNRVWVMPPLDKVMVHCECKTMPAEERGDHHNNECPMWRKPSTPK